MPSLQTARPPPVARSSGSRVRFPVNTTRLMFIARAPFRTRRKLSRRVYDRPRRQPSISAENALKRCGSGTCRCRAVAKQGRRPAGERQRPAAERQRARSLSHPFFAALIEDVMMTRSRGDAEGLLSTARSSPEAFADFYEHFERAVLGFFMHATGRPELAADLTAETFARALEGLAIFDPNRGRADQWLF